MTPRDRDYEDQLCHDEWRGRHSRRLYCRERVGHAGDHVARGMVPAGVEPWKGRALAQWPRGEERPARSGLPRVATHEVKV